jgi:hypothetical protein
MTTSITRSRWAIMTAVLLGTLAFSVASANAFPADRVVCAFQGAAGPLSPGIPIAAGPGNPITDGSYVFATAANNPAVCIQVADTEGDGAAANTPFNVRIWSAGYYTNDFVVGNGNVNGTAGLCETGSAVSEFGTGCAAMTSPVVSPPTWYVPQGSATPLSNGLANGWTAADFGIDFAGGAGTLCGSAVTPNQGRGAALEKNWDGSTNPDAWVVCGAVSITPTTTSPLPPPAGSVTGFAVAGAFTAES